MKEKILPNDINIKSLSELKDMANNIVKKLENVQNLDGKNLHDLYRHSTKLIK